MNLSFRQKILASAGTTGLAFLILILTGEVLDRRTTQQLEEIQDRYIPLVELGPKLEGQLDKLQRSFQDSVSAQDLDELRETQGRKTKLIEQIRAASDVIGPTKIEVLITSLEEYYASALDVSQRLLKKETGVSLVESVSSMQTKLSRAQALLKDATLLDRAKLTEAFTAVSAAQTTSARIRFFISVVCTISVMLLALWLSRGVIQSVQELSTGLTRFGGGDFTQEIPITRKDELGAVAIQANQMAMRIRDLIKELEAFSYSVAHDLRAPLRGILGFTSVVLNEHGAQLPTEAKSSLDRVSSAAKKMGQLIDSLLSLSRLTRKEINRESVNLSAFARDVMEDLQRAAPGRVGDIQIQENVVVTGDTQLLLAVLTNLLGNAWKFTSKRPVAQIQFGISDEKKDLSPVFFIRDNGAGFNMEYADKLFGTFQRLHSNEEFEGTGIGLATVQRIIHRHGGRIWAHGEIGKGATFYFTLGT